MPKHNPEITALMQSLGFSILEHEGHTTYERTRDGFTEIVCDAKSNGCAALPLSMRQTTEYYRVPVGESPELPDRRVSLATLLNLLP